MRKIRKKHRFTFCTILDSMYFPFEIISSVVERCGALIIVLIIAITIIRLMRGEPIEKNYIGPLIIAAVFIVKPRVTRLWVVFYYLYLFRLMLGVESISPTCFVISVVSAGCFAMVYGVMNLYHLRFKDRIVPVLVICVILAFSFNTSLKAVIMHMGTLKCESGIVVGHEVYRQAHYLTVRLDGIENSIELHVKEEIYEDAMKNGFVEVMVYEKWGVKVCKEKAKKVDGCFGIIT